MEKIKVKEKVFSKHWEGPKDTFTMKDFEGFDLLDTDEINFEYDEGYYSENNSWDPFTELTVLRERDETNKELATRKHNIERDEKWAKERRYESYLLYKKEFDGKEDTTS